PNPFNALTSIVYTLESGGKVELTIFDNLGRIVETLVDQHQSASSYTVEWNAHRYASGIYFARLQSPSGVYIIKLVLLQ
ncbi:T9SS type A sorting domain-containing protein, partial [candidate division KSB1 bacterium]|nr:T9SS type A sorting domain-containing protein [candidate division KSB1 bacterium]